MEIIPALDLYRGNCVRLRQGVPEKEIIYSRDPVAMARRWQREGAKRLHIVDLDAAFGGMPVNKKLIINIARGLSIPVQAGGGIRTPEHIKYYLTSGVDRVILGTKILEDKKFLSGLDKKILGRILISLDVRNGKAAIRGWTRTSSVPAISLAKELAEFGVAGIIYTDISRDGMLAGLNIDFVSRLIRAVTLPVIVSGGISSISDIKEIKRLSSNKIEGVIIGQALYSRKIRLRKYEI